MTRSAGGSFRRGTTWSWHNLIRAQTLDGLAAAARLGPVTLVYGARDREHNQAQVIADEIERRLASTPKGER